MLRAYLVNLNGKPCAQLGAGLLNSKGVLLIAEGTEEPGLFRIEREFRRSNQRARNKALKAIRATLHLRAHFTHRTLADDLPLIRRVKSDAALPAAEFVIRGVT